jgi:hypothetical protein
MFTRHKLRELTLELSLCGSIYPRQEKSIEHASEAVSADDVLAMLGPSSVGCMCSTEAGLRRWVKDNVR